jgi:hypothetical protein
MSSFPPPPCVVSSLNLLGDRTINAVAENTIKRMAQQIEAPDPEKYHWESHSMVVGKIFLILFCLFFR